MNYTDICNVPWMFIFVGIILILVLVQNVIMMRKAWKHAHDDLGLDNSQIKKGLTNGILVSIVPTIPVMVVLFALIALLGTPLPWLRLSVIGSATFESLAANIGVESVGETLAAGGFTIVGWIAACWAMSIGGSSNILWSTVAIKPISKLYGAAEKLDTRLILCLGTGCLVGCMGHAAVSFGFSKLATKGIVFLSSFALGAILMFVAKKFPKQKWINDFLMAICMIFGMVIACIVL